MPFFRNLFFLFSLLFSYLSFAQESFLKGHLINKSGQPLAYATVILNIYKDDITYTNAEGFFKIKVVPDNKKHRLKIVFFNEVVYQKTIEISENNLNLGDIKVSSYLKMEEVVVIGEKKAFTVKPDRIVFDVEKISTSVGGNMFDTLEKIPGVLVDNNENINIVGRGATAIAINGKILRTPKSQINAVLKGLNMKDVSSV